jgi:hypothetical protein
MAGEKLIQQYKSGKYRPDRGCNIKKKLRPKKGPELAVLFLSYSLNA